MNRTVAMDEVRGRPADELLREVAEGEDTLRVDVGEGRIVEIKPVAMLKPLLTFEGYVPEGWKDAVYACSQ